MTESKGVLPLRELRDASHWWFLLLLVIADLAFIASHLLLQLTPIIDSGLYSLVRDRGYPEVFQYIKELWIIVLLLSVYLKTRAGGYVAWSLLFGYLLFDDAMQIHEKLGGVIGAHLHLVPFAGLRGQDFGELIVSALAGALLLTLIGWFYLRGAETCKRSTRHLLLLLFSVAFFGVVVDALHMMLRMGGKLNLFWGVVEDGGEMVAISCIAWYLFLLNVRQGELDFSLRRFLGAALARRSGRMRDPSPAG